MSKIYVSTLPVTVKRECNRLSQVTPKSRPSNSLSSVALRLNERTRSPRRRSLCVCAQECVVCVCMRECLLCVVHFKRSCFCMQFFLVSTAFWGLVCSPHAAATCSMCVWCVVVCVLAMECLRIHSNWPSAFPLSTWLNVCGACLNLKFLLLISKCKYAKVCVCIIYTPLPACRCLLLIHFPLLCFPCHLFLVGGLVKRWVWQMLRVFLFVLVTDFEMIVNSVHSLPETDTHTHTHSFTM